MDAAEAERQEAFENLVQAMDEYAVDGVIRRYHIKQVYLDFVRKSFHHNDFRLLLMRVKKLMISKLKRHWRCPQEMVTEILTFLNLQKFISISSWKWDSSIAKSLKGKSLKLLWLIHRNKSPFSYIFWLYSRIRFLQWFTKNRRILAYFNSSDCYTLRIRTVHHLPCRS